MKSKKVISLILSALLLCGTVSASFERALRQRLFLPIPLLRL